MGITAVVTFAIGIPAGIYAALHRNTAADRLTMTAAVMGFSIPNFFLGVLLILATIAFLASRRRHAEALEPTEL